MFHSADLREVNATLTNFASSFALASRIEFDLVAEVEGLAQALGPRAHSAGLELICRVAPAVPDRVVGDPDRLLQILTMLVNNAVRVMAQGEVVMGVSPTNGVALPAPFAEDWTPDSPHSVATEPLSLLFEVTGSGRVSGDAEPPRVDESASCFIEALGGTLSERDHAGHDRVWSFRLALEGAERARSARSEVPAGVNGSSILVADDNATTRLVLQELLSSWGVRVRTAENGEKALAAIREAHDRGIPFSALLLDARMPRLSGFEVAAQLVKKPGLCGPVLLLLPAPFRKGDDAFCRRLGVAARVAKPVRRAELLQALGEVLADRNATDVARSPSSLSE